MDPLLSYIMMLIDFFPTYNNGRERATSSTRLAHWHPSKHNTEHRIGTMASIIKYENRTMGGADISNHETDFQSGGKIMHVIP